MINKFNEVWVWKDILKDKELFLSSLLSMDWQNYNNDGGGNTLIGRSTVLHRDHKAYKVILDLFIKYIMEYFTQNNIKLSENCIDSNKFLVREYSQGSYMTDHSDGYSYVLDEGKEVKPLYTAIIYLNDDYEGGEINFSKDNLIIKPTAVSIVIFPSNKPHSVNEVLNGNRYMTQTYVHEKAVSSYKEK
jgi:predicted 2-oxoglutarate/Fe(II)-dependent dioxygenase YbiX